MPVLTIYGVPPTVAQEDLEVLINYLQTQVSDLLGLPFYEVSVFFPANLVNRWLGEELVCMVDGLFEKPERTIEARFAVAKVIVRGLVALTIGRIPQCKKVEAIVRRFNQNVDGFDACALGPQKT